MVKASGLAAGKGVHVARDVDDACVAVNSMMRVRSSFLDIMLFAYCTVFILCFVAKDRTLGAAGECVVVEELLEGDEVSVRVLSNSLWTPSII